LLFLVANVKWDGEWGRGLMCWSCEMDRSNLMDSPSEASDDPPVLDRVWQIDWLCKGFDGHSAVTVDTPSVHGLAKIILSMWDVLTDDLVVMSDNPPKWAMLGFGLA
jgi:hypothetical protein